MRKFESWRAWHCEMPDDPVPASLLECNDPVLCMCWRHVKPMRKSLPPYPWSVFLDKKDPNCAGL